MKVEPTYEPRLHARAPYEKAKKYKFCKRRRRDENTRPGVEAETKASNSLRYAGTHTPWLAFMPVPNWQDAGKFNLKLHNEIAAFQRWATLKPPEMEARRMLVECIERIAKRRFTDAKVELFGSSATSVVFPTSDIEIVVLTKEPWVDTNRRNALILLEVLFKAAGLTSSAEQTSNEIIPILTFTTAPEYGLFNVDISINRPDARHTVKAVRGYLARTPALRSLVLVIKALLRESGLCSYVIICMCIFFIKINPYNRTSLHYNFPFNAKSLGTLLSDFLRYFSDNFPFATSHLSARKGNLYRRTYRERWRDRNHVMSVECLVNRETNTAQSVRKDDLRRIVTALRKGYSTIVHSSAKAESILSHLVKINEKAIQVRSRICAVVQSGDLSAFLEGLRASESKYDCSQVQALFHSKRLNKPL